MTSKILIFLINRVGSGAYGKDSSENFGVNDYLKVIIRRSKYEIFSWNSSDDGGVEIRLHSIMNKYKRKN